MVAHPDDQKDTIKIRDQKNLEKFEYPGKTSFPAVIFGILGVLYRALKRDFIIIGVQVWIIVHRTAKSVIRTGQILGDERVFPIDIHLGLELKWRIKVIQVIKFTELANEL